MLIRTVILALSLSVVVMASGCQMEVKTGGDSTTTMTTETNGTARTVTVKTIGEHNEVTITDGKGKHVYRRGTGDPEVTQTEKQEIPTKNLARLVVRSDFGNIRLTKSDDDRIHLTTTKHISGPLSKEELRKRLDLVTVKVHQDRDTLKIEPDNSKMPEGIGAAVDFELCVPDGIALNVNSENGTVEVRGCPNAEHVAARSEFGMVTVIQSGKDIEASSANGAVTVSDVPHAKSIEAISDFGNVTVNGVEAEAVTAKSENGAVTLHKARIRERLNMHSDFGQVEADDVEHLSGELDVSLSSENGSIHYSGPATTLSLLTSFGSIEAYIQPDLPLGDAQIKTQNGSVTVQLPKAFSGHFEATTLNGSLHLNGIDAEVKGDGATKSAEATFSGGNTDLSIHSDFGSVTVSRD